MPLGSVADQLVRTGELVEPTVAREYRRGAGALAVGAIPSVTTSLGVTVRVRPLLVPLIVSGYVPTGVTVPLAEVVTVNVAVDPVFGVGAKVALAPAGRPLTVRVTGNVKNVRAIPIEKLVVLPCFTDQLAGD